MSPLGAHYSVASGHATLGTHRVAIYELVVYFIGVSGCVLTFLSVLHMLTS